MSYVFTVIVFLVAIAVIVGVALAPIFWGSP
jgi:hypothetical protein